MDRTINSPSVVVTDWMNLAFVLKPNTFENCNNLVSFLPTVGARNQIFRHPQTWSTQLYCLTNWLYIFSRPVWNTVFASKTLLFVKEKKRTQKKNGLYPLWILCVNAWVCLQNTGWRHCQYFLQLLLFTYIQHRTRQVKKTIPRKAFFPPLTSDNSLLHPFISCVQ